jgi:hypothetical protein
MMGQQGGARGGDQAGGQTAWCIDFLLTHVKISYCRMGAAAGRIMQSIVRMFSQCSNYTSRLLPACYLPGALGRLFSFVASAQARDYAVPLPSNYVNTPIPLIVQFAENVLQRADWAFALRAANSTRNRNDFERSSIRLHAR